jgi:membrane-associated phospholipid phosphatase
MLRFDPTLPRGHWTAASLLSFVIAATTGLARIAVGAHFPGDVLGGALIGCTLGYVTSVAMDSYRPGSRQSSAAASLH